MADIVSFYPSPGTELNFEYPRQSVRILSTIYSAQRYTVIRSGPITAQIFIYLQVFLKNSLIAIINVRGESLPRKLGVNTGIRCVSSERGGGVKEGGKQMEKIPFVASRMPASTSRENSCRYSVSSLA